ncbi:cell division protein FtsL [Litorisediminicola beolgyonensis]|uniref:Cell division protein FtsL n=1 Tax=Litorisediminicola beolgyonensis TaxID=1173614 RepID=A0ABW3ZLE4_9RHOB
MRSVFYVLSFLTLIGLAFWVYHENYTTRAALGETERLQAEIGAARERLAVLKAEWAYLNRPDRLRDLADFNFDRLGLLPFLPEQFGRVDQVAYPAPPPLEITGAVDVSSRGGQP